MFTRRRDEIPALFIIKFANDSKISRLVHLNILHTLFATWREWVDGVCSATCGGGTQMQTRTCNDLDTTDNVVCDGVGTRTQSCITQTCPG